MTRFDALFLLLSVFVGVVGCGPADDAPDLGGWTFGDDSLTATETLLVSGTDDFYFGAVTDLDVTTDGRLLVADREATNVKVLRPDGTLLDTLGGAGGGPGEFEALSSVQAARGDSIYAFDPIRSRLHVFGPASPFEVSRTVTIPREDRSANALLVLREHLVGAFSGGLGTPEDGIREPPPLLYRLVREGGAPSDTLFRVRRTRMAMKRIGSRFRGHPLPFARTSKIALGPDRRLYHGWTDSLRVTAYALDGGAETVADVPTPPVPVQDSERDSVLDEMSTEMRPVVASGLPDTKSAFTDLLVSGEGRLWVRRPPAGPEADRTAWWVLNPGTQTIRALSLPSAVDLEVVWGRQAYGTTTTDRGAPAVVRYRIDKG